MRPARVAPIIVGGVEHARAGVMQAGVAIWTDVVRVNLDVYPRYVLRIFDGDSVEAVVQNIVGQGDRSHKLAAVETDTTRVGDVRAIGLSDRISAQGDVSAVLRNLNSMARHVGHTVVGNGAMG